MDSCISESGVQGESGAGDVNLGTVSVWKLLSTMRWMRSPREPTARGRGSAETLPARSALQKLGILLLLLVLHEALKLRLMPSCQGL